MYGVTGCLAAEVVIEYRARPLGYCNMRQDSYEVVKMGGDTRCSADELDKILHLMR